MKKSELSKRIEVLENEFAKAKSEPITIISSDKITIEEWQKKQRAKIDDTSAFGIPHHNHSKHRVYVDGLTYEKALQLQAVINMYLS